MRHPEFISASKSHSRKSGNLAATIWIPDPDFAKASPGEASQR